MKQINKTATQQIADLIQQGIECWIQAGTIIATEVKKNKYFKEILIRENPMLNIELVNNLQKVGEGSIIPELISSECPTYKRARTLSITDQKRLVSKRIPLLINNGKHTDTILVNSINLDKGQTNQLIGKNGIRNQSEQKLYLLNKIEKEKTIKIKKETPYQIKNGKLKIRKNVEFTKQELQNLIKKMK